MPNSKYDIPGDASWNDQLPADFVAPSYVKALSIGGREYIGYSVSNPYQLPDGTWYCYMITPQRKIKGVNFYEENLKVSPVAVERQRKPT